MAKVEVSKEAGILKDVEPAVVELTDVEIIGEEVE